MDSLNDILLKKDFDEPPEIAAIKAYVERQFKAKVGVQMRPTSLTIIAGSAPLASALRLHTHELRQAAQTDKKLFFRIGS